MSVEPFQRRSRVRRLGVAVMAVLLVIPVRPLAQSDAPAAARAPSAGPRDGQPNAAANGRIRGRVVVADTGAPLKRAEVVLAGRDLEARVAYTDDRGRYEFADLPKGRFRITASKPGFASVQYGQKRPFHPGRTIDLEAGQSLDRVDLAAPRGAVITGRLTDELGEPAVGVMVAALRYSSEGGQRRMMPIGAADTDDRGVFRIFGLAAGEYVLSAQPPPRVGLGQASGAPGTAPTFFPGTPRAAEAQRISVTAGLEQSAANFALVSSRTVKVTGVVVASSGAAATAGVVYLQQNSTLATFAGSASVQRDGGFTLTNIAPGEYVLETRIGADDVEGETASTPLMVDGGDDVTGLVVTTSGATVFAGRIAFDGASDALKTSDVLLWTHGDDIAGPFARGGRIPVRVHDDWSFEGRVSGGTFFIAAGRLPDGWMLRSVLLDGEDVTESGVTAGGDRIDGLQVVLTNGVTRLTGSATGDLGRSVREYVAVVFPAEPSWSPAHRRRVRVAVSDEQGRFEIAKLPPGQYMAAAVEDVEEGQEADPEFLESLRASATPFDLREGETATVTLRLATRR